MSIVRWRFTDRDDGDLRVDQPSAHLERRRAALVERPWSWLDQVHGDEVVVVRAPGDRAGAQADALVSSASGAVLAVHTADCAGVLLAAPGRDGPVIGAAHAGWRGLRAGVLQRTVEEMRALGAGEVRWRLGPCISADHYEFGESELVGLVERYGDGVRAVTAQGLPALDLRAGVRVALAEVDARPAEPGVRPPCTSAPRYYSWRTRADRGRQAAITWIEPT